MRPGKERSFIPAMWAMTKPALQGGGPPEIFREFPLARTAELLPDASGTKYAHETLSEAVWKARAQKTRVVPARRRGPVDGPRAPREGAIRTRVGSLPGRVI